MIHLLPHLLAFSNPLKPLEHLLQHILIWLHVTGGLTWAWSIVALTVLVRILLVPVTVKQIHSMQNLQAHAPEMKALQQKWKHDKQRQNEELMKFYRENKINPAASCLPMVLQIPIFISLFYVLRHFDERVLPDYIGSSVSWLHLVDITEPVKDGWGPLLLVIYVASQLSSSYFMSSTMQGAQRILLMVLPVLFVPFIIKFPAGLMLYWLTTNLWTTGQGLVTRRLMPKPALPEKRSSRTPAKDDPPPEVASGNGTAGTAKAATPARKPVAGPPRRVKRKKGGGRGQTMTEITVEATGETVGEAKWTALRELQRRVPGLDRDAIRFQVVSEGERGLLGVGYTPASVVATAEVPAEAPIRESHEGEEGQAALVRELLERTVAASGVEATVHLDESGEELVATLVGADLGVLIGRHGQTIDALQYLSNAIGYRSQGDDRKRVVVDAAGYRARRAATLETAARRAAEQAAATGHRVELDPMTAVERRIVHELLKDDPEVETSSEGSEPNRFVVVLPRRSAD